MLQSRHPLPNQEVNEGRFYKALFQCYFFLDIYYYSSSLGVVLINLRHLVRTWSYILLTDRIWILIKYLHNTARLPSHRHLIVCCCQTWCNSVRGNKFKFRQDINMTCFKNVGLPSHRRIKKLGIGGIEAGSKFVCELITQGKSRCRVSRCPVPVSYLQLLSVSSRGSKSKTELR